jgi:membrane protease YdiL (CAAX protease family)
MGSVIKWVVYAALVGVGASFIFWDLLILPLDLYYLIYFGIVVAFIRIYVKRTGLNLKEWASRRLAWGILLGLIFGAVMVKNVLARPETIGSKVLVTMLYAEMLRRSPEQEGFDFGVGYLDSSNSELVIIDGILNSQEYADRFI